MIMKGNQKYLYSIYRKESAIKELQNWIENNYNGNEYV